MEIGTHYALFNAWYAKDPLPYFDSFCLHRLGL